MSDKTSYNKSKIQTDTTRCLDQIGSLLCDRKKDHKGNHGYKNRTWTRNGKYLGMNQTDLIADGDKR